MIALLGTPVVGRHRRAGVRAAAVELIAYLALHPEGGTSDQLLEALWPDVDPKRSRQRLWQAARDGRRLLGDTLTRDRDRYRLDRQRLRIDVDELDRLLAAAGTAEADDVGPLVARAFALFRDVPLAGTDYRWAAGHVRRLRATYLELAERIARQRIAGADPRGCLDMCERALAGDPLNERLWRLALRAEADLGLRDNVAQRYEQLRTLLADRIGLEPERATRALYLQLLSQH